MFSTCQNNCRMAAVLNASSKSSGRIQARSVLSGKVAAAVMERRL